MSAIIVTQGLLEDDSSHLVDVQGDLFAFGITAAMIQSAQSKMKEAKSQLHTVNKERNNQEKI